MGARAGRRFVVCVLIALGAILVVSSAAPATEYPDVPTWYWAWSYVQGVSDAGVSAGYVDGNWRPSWVVSRDQMAVFIARAMCGGDEYVPAGPDTATFEDVPNTGYGGDETDPFWAYDYVEYAVTHGVTSGYEDGLYHPGWEVTRGQMAAFMARAMCGGEESVPEASGDPQFPDVTDTENSWCYKHVEYIAGEGVTQGYEDGEYHPEESCRRDQMAAYLCRAFDLATPTAPAFAVTDYFPLEEGDTWVSTDESAELTTRTVTGTKELHGRTCTVILDAANDAGDYWISDTDGLYYCGEFDSDEDLSFDPPLLFPDGIRPGDSGTSSSTLYDFGVEIGPITFSWEFVGFETLTVPAGTFEGCMKIHMTSETAAGPGDLVLWLAKDVGIARGEVDGEWYELQSADVGGTHYPTTLVATDYFPLAEGDTWVVKDGTGHVSTRVVTGTKELHGCTCSVVLDAVDNEGEYWLDGPTGVSYCGEFEPGEDISFDPPFLIPNGIVPGDSGSTTMAIYNYDTQVGTQTLAWEFLGYETVTVPAGTFADCLKLHITNPNDTSDLNVYAWMAEDVGRVKEENIAWPEDSLELQSANVGGTAYP